MWSKKWLGAGIRPLRDNHSTLYNKKLYLKNYKTYSWYSELTFNVKNDTDENKIAHWCTCHENLKCLLLMLVMLLGLGTVWIWAVLPHFRGTGYFIFRVEVSKLCICRLLVKHNHGSGILVPGLGQQEEWTGKSCQTSSPLKHWQHCPQE